VSYEALNRQFLVAAVIAGFSHSLLMCRFVLLIRH